MKTKSSGFLTYMVTVQGVIFDLYSVISHGQTQKKTQKYNWKFRWNLDDHEKAIQLPPNIIKL